MQPIQAALDRRAPRTARPASRPNAPASTAVVTPVATLPASPAPSKKPAKKRTWRQLYAQVAFMLSAMVHLLLLLVLVAVTVQRYTGGSIMGLPMLATFASIDEVTVDIDDVQLLDSLPETDPEIVLNEGQQEFGDDRASGDEGEGDAAEFAGAGGRLGTTSLLLDAAFVSSSTSAAVMSSETNAKILSRLTNTTVTKPIIKDLTPVETLILPGGKVDVAAPPAKVEATFFGSTAKGLRFVFVVDHSGSMAGDRWNRARAEVVRCLEELGRGQAYAVILYSDRPTPEHKTLVGANGRNVDATRAWLAGKNVDGGTNPIKALEQAYKLGPDAIFLLSDGEFDSPDAVIKKVTELNTGKTPIHAISFVQDLGEGALKDVAVMTGGQFTHVK